jgi:hypothetical protein
MSNFENFITQLLQTQSYPAAFNAYSDYIESLNFCSMSYVFMPNTLFGNHKDNMPRFSVTENFSKSFLEEYAARDFQNNDYIVDAVNNGQSNCLFLWEQDRKSGKLNSCAAKIIDNAKYDHNMGNGCSILTKRSTHGIGAVSLIGDESDQLFARYIAEHKKTLSAATELFNNYIIANSYEINPFVMHSIFSDLNKTEKQILKCLLDGDTVPKTAKKINKSKGYIENLIREMRIKVGGLTVDGRPRISKDKLVHYSGLMRIYSELN